MRSDKIDLEEEIDEEDEDDEEEDLARLNLENGEEDDVEQAEEDEEEDEGEDAANGHFHSDFDEEVCSDADTAQELGNPCSICDKCENHLPRISCARDGCPSTGHIMCSGRYSTWFCQPSCSLRA